MGALIQTKGTQRLAEWFNKAFDDSATGLLLARRVKNNVGSGETLLQSFKKGANSLLDVSDAFIAQNAVPATAVAATTPTWPAGGNDVLYPSATMKLVSAVSTTVLRFAFPAGITAVPTFISDGSAVSCLKGAKKKIPRGTCVSGTPTTPGPTGTFDVTLSGAVNTANFSSNEFIIFTKGGHQQLVRRWRWYLKNDLRTENDATIKQAIVSALDDEGFQKITFQALEDTQKVITRTETRLGPDLEFDDLYHLHIVLMTQQTTATDALDQQ